MHFLADIEEQLEEHRRQRAVAGFSERDIEVIEAYRIQKTSGGIRAQVASALVSLSLKLDPDGRYATSRNAA